MEKEDSLDKLDKQIKELQEETEHYNDMLEDTIDEDDDKMVRVVKDPDEEDTKEFNEEEVVEQLEDEEDTKEFNKTEETKQEEYIPKHEKEEESKIEEKHEEPAKENKKKKKNIIIIALIIGIILSLIIIIIFVVNMNKKETKTIIEEDQEETYSAKELKKILNNYGNSIENVIKINQTNKKENELNFEEAKKLVEFPNKVECKTEELYKDGKLYLADCTIDGHKTKATYGEKQEAKEEETTLEDGSFYVYEKDNIATLEEPKNKDEYKSYLVTTNTTPTEIALFSKYDAKYVYYFDSDYNVHVKNFKKNADAVALNNIKSVLPIKTTSGFNTNYVGITDGNKWGIYNLNTGLTDIKMIYNSIALSLNIGISGPPEYITALTEDNIAVQDVNNNVGVINYKTGNVVIPFDTNAMQKSGSYLWKYQYSYNDKTNQTEYTNKTIYDFDGNKYLENKYDDIYGIVNGKYILVKDGKNIKMVQIDGKELYNYKEIDNLGTINYFIDYNQEPLFQFNKLDKKGTTYENECIEVSYDSKTKKGAYKDYACGGIAKPILYLYPTEQTNVKITFEHPDLLKTTYPKYNKEWNVTVKEDGTITDQDGKNYYALYWDEKQKNKVKFKTGFYVTNKNAIKFLEQKLFEIGLTERESNEFIMYWLPVLEENKKSLVYFELTEEKEKYNKINIEPKPDSLLRVTIHIKKVNKETKIKEQTIKQFNRIGFTAVEWGGVTY